MYFFYEEREDDATCKSVSLLLSYFFDYKTEFVPIKNNPKNLDPSYKMDLDLMDSFGSLLNLCYSKISCN